MAYPFHGLVLISSCDKIVPDMLTAMLRLNIFAIMISRRPMLAVFKKCLSKGRSGRLVKSMSIFRKKRKSLTWWKKVN